VTAGVDRWVLAIDLGSTGLKVGAVRDDGTIAGSVAFELTTTFTHDGGVEQDPHEWWRLIGQATRRLLDDGPLAAAGLVAVGMTGQYASTVPVDADGNPVGQCLMWADDRGGPWSRRAFGGPAAGYRPTSVLPWLRYTGGLPSPGGADPTGHALYLKHARPDLYGRTATLLEPVDYLGLRLTGRAAATPASMVASWLTDNRPGAPLRYVPSLVRRAGRDADRLPKLLPAGSVLGQLSADAARHLGLLPGAPVVAGVPDLHAAHIASGAVDDFAAHLTISTTSWVSCAVPFKKTDVLHQMASVPGVRPGQYLVIDNHETAGACLQWLRDGVLGGSYDELVSLAEQSEPGAGGVLFTPWLKGERSPVDDRALRASFVNVSLDTDRADLVRAVLEGVAHNMRWLVEVADRFAGRRLQPIRVLGGGAQSDLWCQIHADVLGRRVERVDDPEIAQLRGVALYALLSLGDVTLDDAAGRATASRVFDPGPASSSVYEPMHTEFRRLHGRLEGVHHRLNRLR
jgi:xylulokinase